MNEHEKRIRQLLPIAEAGDSRQAAYRAIAEEIDAWMKEDSTLTIRAIGQRFDKGHQWVRTLLDALVRARTTGSEFVIDWKSGKHASVPATERSQVKLATELLAQPGIAEAIVRARATLAARAVRRAVSVVAYEEMQGMNAAAEQRRRDELLPISGHMARITGKLHDFTSELVQIKQDLIEADETPATRMVIIALRELGDVCHDIANALDPDLRQLSAPTMTAEEALRPEREA
jgi:hypothetical protein